VPKAWVGKRGYGSRALSVQRRFASRRKVLFGHFVKKYQSLMRLYGGDMTRADWKADVRAKVLRFTEGEGIIGTVPVSSDHRNIASRPSSRFPQNADIPRHMGVEDTVVKVEAPRSLSAMRGATRVGANMIIPEGASDERVMCLSSRVRSSVWPLAKSMPPQSSVFSEAMSAQRKRYRSARHKKAVLTKNPIKGISKFETWLTREWGTPSRREVLRRSMSMSRESVTVCSRSATPGSPHVHRVVYRLLVVLVRMDRVDLLIEIAPLFRRLMMQPFITAL
jgi:hypothetical protein